MLYTSISYKFCKIQTVVIQINATYPVIKSRYRSIRMNIKVKIC